MTTNVIEVYEIFKELGLKEDKARKVVDLLTETAKEGVATREDIDKLKGDVHRLEMEILELDKKIDRNLYILIIILVILNGDKVLQFLSLFIK